MKKKKRGRERERERKKEEKSGDHIFSRSSGNSKKKK